MAKKKPKQETMGFEDTYPEECQAAADDYLQALRDKNAALANLNSERENFVNTMQNHGLTKIRVDDGKKWLKIEPSEKVKTEKISQDATAADDD